ncbi:MAG: glutamyl-tRNA reductase [Candidatus Brocadiales bacterium]
MSILAIGLNHKSAPVEIREKLAFSPANIPNALTLFHEKFPSSEVVILSTCNRVEMYTSFGKDFISHEQVIDFLSEFHKLEKEKFASHMYCHRDVDAINHLFFVTSSLDSMVVGESQILSQVKEAYLTASATETIGKVLNRLFQKAINVAKDIHTNSMIGKGKVSVSSVAVEFAEKIFQDFSNKAVLIIGAGEMCELVLKHLVERGIETLVVANRSFDRAQALADEYGGKAIKYDLLSDHLPHVDIVISSTSAPHYVIHPEQVNHAIKVRRGNPIFMIDIAVPRDINPEVGKIDNVYLYDIDDLQSVVSKNIDDRSKEMEKCKVIVDKEVNEFMGWLEEIKIGPVIQKLREHFHAVGEEELNRLRPKLKELKGDDWEQVVYAMERTINKLLHEPAKVGKEEAKNGSAYRYAETIRKLFKIPHSDG